MRVVIFVLISEEFVRNAPVLESIKEPGVGQKGVFKGHIQMFEFFIPQISWHFKKLVRFEGKSF